MWWVFFFVVVEKSRNGLNNSKYNNTGVFYCVYNPIAIFIPTYYWLLAVDNAFDSEAKYITFLCLDLFKPLWHFSAIILTTLRDWVMMFPIPFFLCLRNVSAYYFYHQDFLFSFWSLFFKRKITSLPIAWMFQLTTCRPLLPPQKLTNLGFWF